MDVIERRSNRVEKRSRETEAEENTEASIDQVAVLQQSLAEQRRQKEVNREHATNIAQKGRIDFPLEGPAPSRPICFGIRQRVSLHEFMAESSRFRGDFRRRDIVLRLRQFP